MNVPDAFFVMMILYQMTLEQRFEAFAKKDLKVIKKFNF